MTLLGQFTASSSQFINKRGVYLGRRSSKIHVGRHALASNQVHVGARRSCRRSTGTDPSRLSAIQVAASLPGETDCMRIQPPRPTAGWTSRSLYFRRTCRFDTWCPARDSNPRPTA